MKTAGSIVLVVLIGESDSASVEVTALRRRPSRIPLLVDLHSGVLGRLRVIVLLLFLFRSCYIIPDALVL